MDDDSDSEDGAAKTAFGRRTKASLPISRASVRLTRKRQAAKSLSEDLLDQMENDPLDLLDRQRTRSALQSSSHLKRKTGSQDEPELDPDGRLVVQEDGSYLRKPKSLSEHDSDTRSQTNSRHSGKSSAKTQKKRQKTSDSGFAYTGNEYTSRKASGDLKKKDKLDPYAYWPLDRKAAEPQGRAQGSCSQGHGECHEVCKGTRREECFWSPLQEG